MFLGQQVTQQHFDAVFAVLAVWTELLVAVLAVWTELLVMHNTVISIRSALCGLGANESAQCSSTRAPPISRCPAAQGLCCGFAFLLTRELVHLDRQFCEALLLLVRPLPLTLPEPPLCRPVQLPRPALAHNR